MVLSCLNIVVTRLNQYSVAWDCVNQQIAVFIFGSPVSLFCMYPVFCAFLDFEKWKFLCFSNFQRSSFLYSFRYWVETVRTHCKRRTNIKTCTMSYYISVLLVSLVWILLICHFSTVFPEIWWGAAATCTVFDHIDVSTFSLLVIEWKLCAHTTSDLQTSKLAQCYTILACCWYHWCEYCRFVIFQLCFLKYLWKAQKAIFTSQVLSFDVFYFLSFGYRVETVRTHYKRRTNI